MPWKNGFLDHTADQHSGYEPTPQTMAIENKGSREQEHVHHVKWEDVGIPSDGATDSDEKGK
jgi:ribonuclease HII